MQLSVEERSNITHVQIISIMPTNLITISIHQITHSRGRKTKTKGKKNWGWLSGVHRCYNGGYPMMSWGTWEKCPKWNQSEPLLLPELTAYSIGLQPGAPCTHARFLAGPPLSILCAPRFLFCIVYSGSIKFPSVGVLARPFRALSLTFSPYCPSIILDCSRSVPSNLGHYRHQHRDTWIIGRDG